VYIYTLLPGSEAEGMSFFLKVSPEVVFHLPEAVEAATSGWID
jgi:hypothetical protein